jgi:hypothetical protein
MWNLKTTVIARNNRDNWHHITVIQKIPEQHTCEERHQGTEKISRTGHCKETAENTNGKWKV